MKTEYWLGIAGVALGYMYFGPDQAANAQNIPLLGTLLNQIYVSASSIAVNNGNS